MTQTKNEISSYDQQALDFMTATKTGIVTSFKDHALYFPADKQERDIYKVTMTTPKGQYTFTFGQSINDSDQNTPPSAYSIFCAMTKYDPGTFEDFCGDFGYDTDSRSAERTYNSVCKEYEAMSRLFTPEQLELMAPAHEKQTISR